MMSDYEIAVELAKDWTKNKHPDKAIEPVPEGEAGSFLVRAGRAQLIVRCFILAGYRGLTYPGKVLPIPQSETKIARSAVTYFIFHERLELAYVLKGSHLEGLQAQEHGDLGRCYLVSKENVESIIDFTFNGRLDRFRDPGTAVPAGVQSAGSPEHAQRVQERGPLFEAQARQEVASGSDDDYSGL